MHNFETHTDAETPILRFCGQDSPRNGTQQANASVTLSPREVERYVVAHRLICW